MTRQISCTVALLTNSDPARAAGRLDTSERLWNEPD